MVRNYFFWRKIKNNFQKFDKIIQKIFLDNTIIFASSLIIFDNSNKLDVGFRLMFNISKLILYHRS
jgi:hypothetical protein